MTETTKQPETGLERNDANFVPLSPLSYLRRTVEVYPDRVAIVHGDIRRTWSEMYDRCRQLASALQNVGIKQGDVVAIMAPNIPEFIEASHGVPMAGAVLNSLNIRLDPQALAFILNHSDAKVVLVDTEFAGPIQAALEFVEQKPVLIDIVDPLATAGDRISELDYETFLESGDISFDWALPEDEWQSIALNYTSGTTGDPKGVLYSHRGAYLNATANIVATGMQHHASYLWTLPLFHCNGWCFCWTITALAGTHVCLRKVDPEEIFALIAKEGVTHLAGAPIVVSMMINLEDEKRTEFTQDVKMLTGGASPASSVISRMEARGITLEHVYGLTEIYGPTVICAWKPEWDEKPADERAKLKARQGVRYEMQEDLAVAIPDTLEAVPKDGETMGEVLVRGNIVMKGYLKNPLATQKAFEGGWFHTGDLAVQHPDGYIEIRDRSKDIIISGGENISSIEVEDVLHDHPAISSVAVVAKPDEKWGEVPCAFVELLPGASATEGELIAWLRGRIAHFKCPRHVVFGEIPKTGTGKIQKFHLRETAKSISI